jgi:hypothetical protein
MHAARTEPRPPDGAGAMAGGGATGAGAAGAGAAAAGRGAGAAAAGRGAARAGAGALLAGLVVRELGRDKTKENKPRCGDGLKTRERKEKKTVN